MCIDMCQYGYVLLVHRTFSETVNVVCGTLYGAAIDFAGGSESTSFFGMSLGRLLLYNRKAIAGSQRNSIVTAIRVFSRNYRPLVAQSNDWLLLEVQQVVFTRGLVQ